VKRGDRGIVVHGVSLLREILAGFDTRHDTPPSQAPSPIFEHSSLLSAERSDRTLTAQHETQPDQFLTKAIREPAGTLPNVQDGLMRVQHLEITPLSQFPPTPRQDQLTP